MQDLNSIKLQITGMAGIALDMWQATHKTFMEHDPDLMGPVLKDEERLNNLEKELTGSLIELGKCSGDRKEKSNITVYADIVGDLELIGDYCKDILERVQIKIEEKLLFSDDAVKEYNDLYKKTEYALKNLYKALETGNADLLKDIRMDKGRIDEFVETCRKRHDQRLIKGVCSPLACNMFLNMLDYTAQIFHRTRSIANNVVKLK